MAQFTQEMAQLGVTLKNSKLQAPNSIPQRRTTTNYGALLRFPSLAGDSLPDKNPKNDTTEFY
jgi:hypothetical protein